MTTTAQVSLTIDSKNLFEDSDKVFLYTFSRTGGDLSEDLAVNFTVDGSAEFGIDYSQEGASEFDADEGKIIIPANQNEITLLIKPIADSEIESDETVKLTLESGENYTIEDSQVSLQVERIASPTDINSVISVNSVISNDDTNLNVDWVKQFGVGFGYEYLAVDDEGSTYVTGKFSDSVTFKGEDDITITSAGGSDAFVAKLDEDGNVEWAKEFGDTDSEEVKDITLDEDGNIYITGTTDGGEGSDVFAAKFNNDGDLQWREDFGNNSDAEASGIEVDDEGNTYITGEFEGQLTFSDSLPLLDGGQFNEVFVAKLDSNGDVLWAKDIDNPSYADEAADIVVDEDGNSYLFMTEGGENGEKTALVTKLNSAGDEVWSKEFFGNNDVDAENIAIYEDDIYVTGKFEETLQFDNEIIEGAENGGVFIAKLASNGELLWAENFDSGENDDVEVEGIAVDEMGNTYIAGYYNSDTITIGDFMLYDQGGEGDAFITKLDSKGEVKWAQNIAGTNSDSISDIAVKDGKIYLAGSFYDEATFGDETLSLEDSNDTFLVKLEEEKSQISLAVDSTKIIKGENNQITYTFTRMGEINAALTIDFSISGSAIYETDYTLNGADEFDGSQGKVTFNAGETTTTVTLEITSEVDFEEDKTVSLTLEEGDDYNIATSDIDMNTVTITDSDDEDDDDDDDDDEDDDDDDDDDEDDDEDDDDDDDDDESSGGISGENNEDDDGDDGGKLTLKSESNKTFNFTGKSSIKFSFKSTTVQEVKEIAYFTVDDDEGMIDGISPNDERYTEVALQRAQSIFAILGNVPTGFDTNFSSSISFESDTRFRLLSVKGGSLTSVKAGKIELSQVSISSDTFLDISEIAENTFDLGFAGLEIEMKVDAEVTTTIGTKLQKEKQLEVIDFREITTKQTATFTINREAEYNNFVGFFQAIDEEGGIDTNGDGTADILVGQAGYAEAAVQNRIAGIDLSVANQSTATFTGEFEGGSVIIPFLIVDGSPDAFTDGDSDNNPDIFFPMIGANSDGEDHIMILADNTFGFEDLVNGGDRDYNDITLKIEFGNVTT